jgi:hypothetical protein
MHPQQPQTRRATIERALAHLEDGLEHLAIAADLIRGLDDPILNEHVLPALDTRRADRCRDAVDHLRTTRDHPTRDEPSDNTTATHPA